MPPRVLKIRRTDVEAAAFAAAHRGRSLAQNHSRRTRRKAVLARASAGRVELCHAALVDDDRAIAAMQQRAARGVTPLRGVIADEPTRAEVLGGCFTSS